KLYYVLSVAVIIIVVMVSVVYYVDGKKDRLYADILNSIEKVFNGHDEMVDILYNDKQVYFRAINIPGKYSDTIESYYEEDYNKTWEEYYGDVVKLYSIDSDLSKSLYSDYDECTDGWRLIILRPTSEGVDVRFLFPFGIGYRQQETSFDYLFAPKIKNIVSSNLEWITQDPMSDLSRNFEKGKFRIINNKLRNDIKNDYYSIPFVSKDKIEELPVSTDSVWEVALLSPQSYNRKKTVFKKFDMTKGGAYVYELAKAKATGDYVTEKIPDPIIYPYTYIYDKFSKLYIGTTRPILLKIREIPNAIRNDIIKLVVIWSIIGIALISLVFFSIGKIKGLNNKNEARNLPIITDGSSDECIVQDGESDEINSKTNSDIEIRELNANFEDLPEDEINLSDEDERISMPDEDVSSKESSQLKNKTKPQPYANFRVKIY
ncbi:MAG: hypothetical protein K2K25_02315, partial [Muribaculaceae bacterium]|nr:hypothetical protein [Muribaculaceae bacterium]